MQYQSRKSLFPCSLVIAGAMAMASPMCLAQKTSNWGTASDALAIGLPAAAGALTVWNSDVEGFKQLALSGASTVAASELLKGMVHVQRPDGSDNKSFPSAHTAVAFTAVAYLDRRYGAQLAPWQMAGAYGLAALTGVARVQANKHRWADVAAGAALGYGSARYWTEPARDGQLAVLPTSRGVAIAWARSF